MTVQAQETYQTDPIHVELRDQHLKRLLDPTAKEPRIMAVDYEFDPPASCPFGWKSFLGAEFVLGAIAGALGSGVVRTRS